MGSYGPPSGGFCVSRNNYLSAAGGDNAKRLHKDRANRYSNNQHHSYDVGNDPTIYSYYLNFLNLFEYKYFPGDNLVWAVVQQLFGRNCFKFNLLEAEFF